MSCSENVAFKLAIVETVLQNFARPTKHLKVEGRITTYRANFWSSL